MSLLSSTDKLDPGIDLNVVPEVAAEVVGYARSAFRKSGLHLLVDVGASTLDVCGFVLHQADGEDVYSLLTAVVERLGVHELHRTRLRTIDRSESIMSVYDIDLGNPLSVIPESILHYLGDCHQNSGTRDHVDAKFGEECARQLLRCLYGLRRWRDPNSPSWKEGLPVFLCGGGAKMQFYRRIADDVNGRCLRSWHDVNPFAIQTLPTPSNLATQDISEDLYQRLAVAYGLSFDRFEIGNIVAPEEIQDIPPPSDHPPRHFVSKDEV